MPNTTMMLLAQRLDQCQLQFMRVSIGCVIEEMFVDTTNNSYLLDPARLFALERLDLLDSPPEPAYDRLTRLASRLLNVPVALISLVDHDRQFFKSQVGLAEPWATSRQTPLSHSFCQHVVKQQAPLVIEDARDHPLVANNLAIPDLGVIAYAGMPLRAPTGETIGACCAIDTEPRIWSAEELAILEDLSQAVMAEITLRDKIKALQESEAQRSGLQDELVLANKQLLDELSSPIISVADDIFVAPLLGRLDTYRVAHLQATLGRALRKATTGWVIIDGTHLKVADDMLAGALVKTMQLVHTHGAEILLTAMPPEVAQKLAQTIEPATLVSYRTLPDGIAFAMEQRLAKHL